MKKLLMKCTVLAVLCCVTATAQPKIAVMETAFGNRSKVESVAMAKEAGYAGVQIHTGNIGSDGILTLARLEVIEEFKAARKKHGIEIVSLCAGSMNGCNSQDPEAFKKAVNIGRQSIEACGALDVPVLLVPFFGKAQFGNDPEDPKVKEVVKLFKKLLPFAKRHGVILGLESPSKKPAVVAILNELNHPNLKVYYDTGNMQGQGEDVYSVIEQLGADKICEIHLKPFESPNGIFGNGKTDLDKLAAAIKKTGYSQWFVFEAGGGKFKRDVPFAAENRKGIQPLCDKLTQ